MKRYLTGSAIVALAIAGAGGTYLAAFAEPDAIKQGTADLQRMVDEKVAPEIQSRLASAVDSAVTHGGYPALVGSLDKATRDRLGMEKDSKRDELNTRIAQFRTDFKTKYNQDFNLKAAELAKAAAYRGADDDHVTVPLSAFSSLDARNDNPAGANARDSTPLTGQISLVRESTLITNGWRIMIPERVSGQQLRDALGSKLAAISSDKAAWPANVHDAYRTMAGQILQSLTQPGAENMTVENH